MLELSCGWLSATLSPLSSSLQLRKQPDSRLLAGKGREDKDEGEPRGCSCALSHCQLCSAVLLPRGPDSPATRPATKGSTFLRTKHLAGLVHPARRSLHNLLSTARSLFLHLHTFPQRFDPLKGRDGSLYPPTGWFLAAGSLLPQMS